MGTATVPVPGSPVIAQSGNTIKWSNVTNAVKYGVYFLEKDPEISRTFNANLVQLTNETQFSAEKGKSYYVTAINEDNAESDKSIVLTTN
jgi:hypothetical protein